ncbi:GIY-YIG nuclease family protein [Streptomyces althioticus]|uniref:GIY-YIG nuclease family protein n=1 Tax=Streptomyces althioticus TaxID=83380 RepID=UPI003412AFC0
MQQDTAPRPAAVYRLYDEAGRLLYIGSAYDPAERAKAHKHADWWPLVVRRDDEWYVSRDDAYRAERLAIEAEQPPHNVVGTPKHTDPAVRGRILREAASARWTVALAAFRAGASVDAARRAGGWAEVEYLEASGRMQGYAAKLRRDMEERGGTYNSENMRLDDTLLALTAPPRPLPMAPVPTPQALGG